MVKCKGRVVTSRTRIFMTTPHQITRKDTWSKKKSYCYKNILEKGQVSRNLIKIMKSQLLQFHHLSAKVAIKIYWHNLQDRFQKLKVKNDLQINSYSNSTSSTSKRRTYLMMSKSWMTSAQDTSTTLSMSKIKLTWYSSICQVC